MISRFEEVGVALSSAQKVLVDSTGLAKPYLFLSVRDSLRRLGGAFVLHTTAEQYYPRSEDLRAKGITMTQSGSEVFESLPEVLMGEAGPYTLIRVHHEKADPQRWSALIASASPKNDRLLHLFDQRTYNAARVLVPPVTTEARRVARAAAELAASAADSNVGLIEVDTDDLERSVQMAEEVYSELYFRSGANVELGLTGSKMHAVAFASLAAAGRIASAWYVKPARFDEQRFTTGVRDTRCFELGVKH